MLLARLQYKHEGKNMMHIIVYHYSMQQAHMQAFFKGKYLGKPNYVLLVVVMDQCTIEKAPVDRCYLSLDHV